MHPLDPPIRAPWSFSDFPDHIEIDGVVFNRAIRKQGYTGVIEQYRAATPRDSAHLLVLEDGTYQIDHVDEYNPDMGYPVRHWLVDHPRGVATVILGAGALGLGAAAVYGQVEKEKEVKP